jgi:hypothetical protein
MSYGTHFGPGIEHSLGGSDLLRLHVPPEARQATQVLDLLPVLLEVSEMVLNLLGPEDIGDLGVDMQADTLDGGWLPTTLRLEAVLDLNLKAFNKEVFFLGEPNLDHGAETSGKGQARRWECK